MFPRIGLTGKPGDAEVRRVLDRLSASLAARGVEVVTGADIGPERVDLVICVGGDGSLLHAARLHGFAGLPLIGVNLGRFGFLVDVSPDDFEQLLDEALAGQFNEERRPLLEMTVARDGRPIGDGIALNDVVLHKADPGRMLEFATHIDDVGVTTHRADGMVVATPTGSTAYALSGGGPILHPALDALVLVPICPHTLSDRPLVMSATSRIVLTVGAESGGAQISCDGQPGLALAGGDAVTIMRSERSVRLLHPPDYDYFRILRDKLHWGRPPGPAGR